MAVTTAASWSVEVVYRGIFQKRLANRISRGVVLGARSDGKIGTAFARYGDSPERNGIPAKNFAVVATDEVELEASLARYEPDSVDVSIVVDDTMCKGIESWAWYGIQPINKLVRPGGALVVTSDQEPDALLEHIKVKDYAYTLVVVPSPIHAGVFAPEGSASFAGLWVDNDDNTDFNCLAAVARFAPHILTLDSVLKIVLERTNDPARVAAVQATYDLIKMQTVQPGQGSTIQYEEYTKPGWPQCPDECFEVTPEGTYEVVYEACIGCSVCAEVCPVPDCITMVHELSFDSNENLFPMYESNPDGYRALLTQHGIPLHPELIEKAKKTQPVHAQPAPVAGG